VKTHAKKGMVTMLWLVVAHQSGQERHPVVGGHCARSGAEHHRGKTSLYSLNIDIMRCSVTICSWLHCTCFGLLFDGEHKIFDGG
jgi:hypothetical protein